MPRMFVVKKQDAIVESEGKKNPGINKNNQVVAGRQGNTQHIYIYTFKKSKYVFVFVCMCICINMCVCIYINKCLYT